ncbi:hypothetical protein V5799_012776 [Amblyomma americanum]|uniref:Uncharacterized protein n=1 Tax=Amblyomma americanum TaxID=6943 RepID=A0AAQ4E7X2_AMBAM
MNISSDCVLDNHFSLIVTAPASLHWDHGCLCRLPTRVFSAQSIISVVFIYVRMFLQQLPVSLTVLQQFVL